MYSVSGYHATLAEFSVSFKPHFKYQSASVDPDHNLLELRFPTCLSAKYFTAFSVCILPKHEGHS